MSFSFLVLMSLDKVLIPASDDRIVEPRDLKSGNQSDDVYDKFMVRMIFSFPFILVSNENASHTKVTITL